MFNPELTNYSFIVVVKKVKMHVRFGPRLNLVIEGPDVKTSLNYFLAHNTEGRKNGIASQRNHLGWTRLDKKYLQS